MSSQLPIGYINNYNCLVSRRNYIILFLQKRFVFNHCSQFAGKKNQSVLFAILASFRSAFFREIKVDNELVTLPAWVKIRELKTLLSKVKNLSSKLLNVGEFERVWIFGGAKEECIIDSNYERARPGRPFKAAGTFESFEARKKWAAAALASCPAPGCSWRRGRCGAWHGGGPALQHQKFSRDDWHHHHHGSALLQLHHCFSPFRISPFRCNLFFSPARRRTVKKRDSRRRHVWIRESPEKNRAHKRRRVLEKKAEKSVQRRIKSLSLSINLAVLPKSTRIHFFVYF